MTRPASVLLLVLAVVASVALAGCSLGSGPGPTATTTDEPTVPDGAAAASAYETLGNVTAEVEVTTRYGNRTTTATVDLAADVGTRRIRQRVTAPADRRGNLFVSDADAYWQYNASRDVAAKHPHDDRTFRSTFGTGQETFAAFLEAAFDAAEADDEGTVSDLPDVGVGPAPTVPEDGDDVPTDPTANVSEFAVTYEGTAAVADRDTHVLVVEPANESAVGVEDLTVTYHVDTETYFPVRVVRTATVDGERWRQELTFSDLEYDADVQPSRYAFEPNDSTEVLDYAEDVVTFQTREALAANTSVSLPAPRVPDGYEFQYAAGIELDTTGAQLIYSNGSAALVAGRYVDDGVVTDREREVAENVTVDGHRALYVDLGRTQAVYVYCEEHVVSAAAIGEVPKGTVFDLARSLDCAEHENTSVLTAASARTEGTGQDEGERPGRTAPSRSGPAVQRVDDAGQPGELGGPHR